MNARLKGYNFVGKGLPHTESIVYSRELRNEKETVSPKIAKRVEELKNLRHGGFDDSSQDKTIRLGDKKSAASLSLLFPGLGQVYMGQRAFGVSFVFSNIMLVPIFLFLSGILRISFFSPKLVPSYDFHVLLVAPLAIALLSAISIHMAFGLFPELKLAQLISANRKSTLHWVALMFPGYGQLLNGQLNKGVTFFSLWILGIFSAVSLFFTYSINWYEYIEVLGVRYVEIALIVMLVLIFASFLGYIISIFDAFVVRKYPYLKRSLWSRAKLSLGISKKTKDKAPYRRTSLGFVSISLLLILFLGAYLVKGPYRTFWAEKIDGARIVLKNKGMDILPGLLDRIKVPKSIELAMNNVERLFQ